MRMPADGMLPAPGQGALGIECRAGREDIVELVSCLADPVTAACVRAERAVSRALGGSCTIPLAAHAEQEGDRLRLTALVASVDGKRIALAQCEGSPEQSQTLGEQAARLLGERGAHDILAALGR
jgi:hydroxymethylbilane synthase